MCITFGPEISHVRYLFEGYTYTMQGDDYSRIFTEALFIMKEIANNPFSPIKDWLNKLWSVHK